MEQPFLKKTAFLKIKASSLPVEFSKFNATFKILSIFDEYLIH